MADVHGYVESYRFEFDGGGSYAPTEHEKAMLEDAIEGYIASTKGHSSGCPSGDFGPCDCPQASEGPHD